MSYHMPIIQYGWRDALKEIQTGQGKLVKMHDGHAELWTTFRMASGGKRDIPTENECYGYLTRRSVELLEKALA